MLTAIFNDYTGDNKPCSIDASKIHELYMRQNSDESEHFSGAKLLTVFQPACLVIPCYGHLDDNLTSIGFICKAQDISNIIVMVNMTP